jgi:hypothetical protein
VTEVEEFQRLYGPWQPMRPGEVASLLEGCGFRWWVAGGWALQAAGAEARQHEDTDVTVLHRDLEPLRDWLSGFHLWEADSGSLRPLLPGEEMTDGREQLWMRRNAFEPWLLDILLSPSEGDDWLYKRNRQIRLGLDAIGHAVDGVPYLQPELVLLFKAHRRRPKDELDFAAVAPRLSPPARDFLIGALRSSEPDCPWIGDLEAFA